MASVTYTAVDRGNLAAGHSAGTQYSIDFRVSQPGRKTSRVISERTAMSGKSETLFIRKDIFLDVTTTPVASSASAQWVEFIESVLGGETYTLDMDGTSGAPVSPRSCKLDGDPSEITEGQTDYTRYQFRSREV